MASTRGLIPLCPQSDQRKCHRYAVVIVGLHFRRHRRARVDRNSVCLLLAGYAKPCELCHDRVDAVGLLQPDVPYVPDPDIPVCKGCQRRERHSLIREIFHIHRDALHPAPCCTLHPDAIGGIADCTAHLCQHIQKFQIALHTLPCDMPDHCLSSRECRRRIKITRRGHVRLDLAASGPIRSPGLYRVIHTVEINLHAELLHHSARDPDIGSVLARAGDLDAKPLFYHRRDQEQCAQKLCALADIQPCPAHLVRGKSASDPPDADGQTALRLKAGDLRPHTLQHAKQRLHRTLFHLLRGVHHKSPLRQREHRRQKSRGSPRTSDIDHTLRDGNASVEPFHRDSLCRLVDRHTKTE